MSKPLRFDGQVALITGGGRGLGRSHALALSTRGASVIVNDLGTTVQGLGRDAEPANTVVAEIRAAGGKAVASSDDVSTVDGAEAMVESAIESFGRVDILINNAGIATRKGSFLNTDLEDFQRHIAVHLAGAFNVSRAAWKHMAADGYGRIVMTTSSAFLGRGDSVSYASAKAGLIGLTKSLALAGAEYDIKVNAIAPAAETRVTLEVGVRNVTTLPSGEEVPVSAENASAVVRCLSHRSCPATGEIFSVGAGHVGRLFVGDTLGYTSPDVLVSEDIVDHWEDVIDEGRFYIPLHCTHHSDRLRNPRLIQA